jgi:hypothetical protein
MTDDTDFDLDELERLREQTKNIQLFPSEHESKKTAMDEVLEEEGDAAETSRGDNHTPGKRSNLSDSSPKISAPRLPNPISFVPKPQERSEAATAPRQPPKLPDNRKIVQRPIPSTKPLSQSARALPGQPLQPKPPIVALPKETTPIVEVKMPSSKELYEENKLEIKQPEEPTYDQIATPATGPIQEKTGHLSTPGWENDIGKLIELNAGLREDLEDKRDKLKAYMARLTGLEDRLKIKEKSTHEADDKARQHFLSLQEELNRKYADKERALEKMIKEKFEITKEEATSVLEGTVRGIQESCGILQIEIQKNKDHNERVSSLFGSIEYLVNDHRNIEDKLQQTFERIYETLDTRASISVSQSLQEIEGRMRKARLEIQTDHPSAIYDPDVLRIYEETSKQGSVRRFPIQRAALNENSIPQEDDFNLYTDTSKTTKSIKCANEGSVRSAKGLSQSKTSEKGKFLTASDLNIMKTELSKKVDLGNQPISYPTEDIPDNVSVSSRKSKRVLFNKKPASRSGKIDNEYGLQDNGADNFKSPGSERKYWDTPKQSDDMSELQSQTDTLHVR